MRGAADINFYMQVWCQWLARDFAKVEGRVQVPLLAPLGRYMRPFLFFN